MHYLQRMKAAGIRVVTREINLVPLCGAGFFDVSVIVCPE